ncbi:MAG: hypothetical protein ABR881_06665 [Candidatus Sulfotelmatobacter sp.]
MTLVDHIFFYGSLPSERVLRALENVREVYGIRQVLLDAKACAVRVEYDASRLTQDDVGALLREAGIDIRGGEAGAVCAA